MSQQINLINPALIKQKDFLTAVTIGLAYLFLMALMMGWYVLSNQHLAALSVQRDKAVAELAQVQQSLSIATAERAPRAPSKALLEELERLQGQEKMQAQILAVVKQNQTNAGEGLASVMRGFAKRTVEGLWLTGFSVDAERHALTIRGRSVQPDLLPTYIHLLGQEPVFSGQAFGGLQMKRTYITNTVATSSTNTQSQGNTAPVSNIPKSAQTASTTNAVSNTPSSNVNAPIATQSYIEFELHAQPESTAVTAATSVARSSTEVKS